MKTKIISLLSVIVMSISSQAANLDKCDKQIVAQEVQKTQALFSAIDDSEKCSDIIVNMLVFSLAGRIAGLPDCGSLKGTYAEFQIVAEGLKCLDSVRSYECTPDVNMKKKYPEAIISIQGEINDQGFNPVEVKTSGIKGNLEKTGSSFKMEEAFHVLFSILPNDSDDEMLDLRFTDDSKMKAILYHNVEKDNSSKRLGKMNCVMKIMK